MKKPKEYPTPPFWKENIPRCPEHTEWKRDDHGYPIFHDDGVCVLCKKPANSFSHPWYAFKYQLLGYCEPCVKLRMAHAPTPEEEQKVAESRTVKRRAPLIIPQWQDPKELVKELERIATSL